MTHNCSVPDKGSHKWKRIPRKRAKFDTAGQSGETAFGIEAVYVISTYVILVYHALLLVGWFSFTGWWLERHPGDLQNAVVPLMAFVALEMSVWSLIGRSHST